MTDIIIRTGFLKVTHNIVFQPQTVPKGKALVDANHVCNVEEHRRDGESLWIQAQVIRQASVTSTPYCTKLNINEAREVISVSCNCVYNKSGKCKHIAAVIYYVNHTNSLSKTDQEKQWGKRSARKFAQEKYCKGEYICNLIPQKKKMKFKPFQLDIKNVTEPSPLRVIALEMERDPNEKAANQVMNNLLTTVDVMIERENCEKCINSLFSLSEKKPLYKQDIVIEKEFYDFYANNIVLQKNEIINLCCDTVLQSQCDKWFSARSMRITVSKNVHSIKNRNKKSIETLILELLNPKKIQTPSMRYGIEKEKEALKEFEIIYNVKVQKLGVLVCKNQPWLCASVDGVVFHYDGSITAIIEIKCPSSCQHQPVVDFSSKQSNVNYLHFIDSKLQLKESAVIYTQCQMQMYVSGVDICKLYVYSPVENGSICLTIQRNEIFLKAALSKCEDFYFHYFLPTLDTKKIKESDETAVKRSFTGKNINNNIVCE